MSVSAAAAAAEPARESGRLRRVGSGVGALGPLGASALVVCVLLALLAIFAPLLAPHDPNSVTLSQAYAGSSSQHLLGADSNGRDLLSRLIIGSRTSLLGPLLVTLMAAIVGAILALLCAWFGGWVDSAISRVMDILFSFPGLLLAVVAVAIFGRGLPAAIVALGISYIPYHARVTRSAAIRERSMPYVSALHVQGFSGLRISVRNILPNVFPLIVAHATVAFGYAMIDLAAISFLGLGVQPPTADWGSMVSTGEPGILSNHLQESLFAGIMIVIAVAAFNVLGERLSDVQQGSAR
jgi:peptide/nickel transport system permease protein